MTQPKIIFLFSGKRKSGKDFISEKLLSRFPPPCATIIRLSAPLKHEYASQHGLDYTELLTASQYKEQHRHDMIKWGEQVRARDPSYFIIRAVHLAKGESFPVWIVSDMRRRSDLQYFRTNYPNECVTVRVSASPDARVNRGWKFTKGVDDAASECDLDDVCAWDHDIDTSHGDEATTSALIGQLLQRCRDVGVVVT
ncbi:hypothetical protein HAZT_HAZT002550 [Hyalella azteca]|uniref:Phosphomevalonate kinase n=1 Tax=Hyalella azteca TaxID=294128 RepID=A0A6A0H4F4_HYAAZ|nr:phosphomevalonate kinase-like isoform X2 [Hyalella azteca]KAA0197221.1 hypothetical protein HAZT_HAZT002550 [Hyalella azteca]